MISEVLMWIGALVCIIGASVVIFLGLMTVREFIIDTFYGWKLTHLRESYKYESEMLTLIHLRELKKAYPELEISYKGEELQEWGD